MKEEAVRISVRSLVEFILREGDLDSRSPGFDPEAMQKGSRIHRKIQKQMGSGYRPEVSFRVRRDYEDLSLIVEGRADGLFEKEGRPCIDEIKGTRMNIRSLKEPLPLHLAQAKCYGAMRILSEGDKKIGIQLTYIDLESEQVRRFFQSFAAKELTGWFEELMEEYHRWLSFQKKWQRERNASGLALSFPFPYRKGQKKMVAGVYHAIRKEQQIFIQASTGVGKTMSVIFPAVRSLCEGAGTAVFYLTARTTTRTVAQEAFEILRSKGLRMKVLTITAKEKICLNGELSCNPGDCPYAKGHFDRVNEAVFDLLKGGDSYALPVLKEQARRFMVCPFEMSLDLALWVDACICDYNYVFDPNVKLKRFFGEALPGGYIFLIDEAHNLLERSREMYSASLYTDTFLEAKKRVRSGYPSLKRAVSGCIRQMNLLGESLSGSWSRLESLSGLPAALLRLYAELERLYAEREGSEELLEALLDFYFEVRRFCLTMDLVDEHYLLYVRREEAGGVSVHQMCIEPKKNLALCLSKGRCAVFFSATLLPMAYYRDLYSEREDDYGIYVPSPFDLSRRLVLAAGDTSSRFSRRGIAEYRLLASYIARTLVRRKGNYMIFFPSYRMLEDVLSVYEAEFSLSFVRVIRQTPSMSEQEREAFLSSFEEQDQTLAAFCILGGIFSEGIDLIGEKLIGALIVGTGLPMVCPEREAVRDFYDRKGLDGFAFAYRIPGMNKVLQAAGRVIRTASDLGIILLLDERFLQGAVRELFPAEWQQVETISLPLLDERLARFWKEHEKAEEPLDEQRKEEG